jgi:hypothetical protein
MNYPDLDLPAMALIPSAELEFQKYLLPASTPLGAGFSSKANVDGMPPIPSPAQLKAIREQMLQQQESARLRLLLLTHNSSSLLQWLAANPEIEGASNSSTPESVIKKLVVHVETEQDKMDVDEVSSRYFLPLTL